MTAELQDQVKRAADDGASSAEIGALLRRHWQREREAAFEEGPASDIAPRLSRAMDEAIIALAQAVCDQETAVLATGGFGRGRLAPHSDVDLLVLMRGEDQEARMAPLLYSLWDAGFPLSHSSHTPGSAVAAARTDTVTRTAFLDARFLCGDDRLYKDFHLRFDRLRERTLAAFVAAKIKERDERHDRIEASRYSIEPDVKEGKGGLRDLDTLHWLDRYVSGTTETPTAEHGLSALFTSREQRRLMRIRDFLWSVRAHLHDLAGRGDEKMHFRLQPELARRLGIEASGDEEAVERFMRYYFLNAKEVGRLTGTACALLEERALKESRRGRLLPSFGGEANEEPDFDGVPGLLRIGGRLTFSDHAEAAEDVELIFKLFRALGRHDLIIHPHARATAGRAARQMAPGESIPALAPLFRDILRDSAQVEPVLRAMAECGLLGRYLPLFGSAIGKVEYGLFRRFTLDEHVIQSIGVLSDMLNDRDDGRFVLTKPMAKGFADPVFLYLALLFQEAERHPGETDDELFDRVREDARAITETDDEADLVAFAVVQRDLLYRAASRRLVTAGGMIASICAVLRRTEQLHCLAVVTSCRHRTAGLRSWEEYAKRDVRMLVESVAAYIDGGEEGITAYLERRRQSLRDRARSMLPPEGVGAFDRFIARTGPTFWSMADVPAAADLSLLITDVESRGAAGGAMVDPAPGGQLRILAYTEDEPDRFARFAGVAAEVGGTVWSASAFPLANDGVDVQRSALLFHINRAGPVPGPFEASSEEIEAIRARFDEVALGTGPEPRVPGPYIGDRRAVFDVTPSVKVDADASEDALIVEVEARDRPGLLYYLAGGLSEVSVSIQLAFVATYGHRAVDTFYLQDAPGYKIVDPRRIETIRRQILRTLEAI